MYRFTGRHIITEKNNEKGVNSLPHIAIYGFSNSAANKDMMS